MDMRRFFKMGLPLLFVGVGFFAASCLNTSEEALYPQLYSGCDTVPGIYNRDVARLINAKCTSCHSLAGQTEPFFESYAQVSEHGSHLLERVKKDPSDPLFMPKGGSKLTACEIKTLEKWVANGQPQN